MVPMNPQLVEAVLLWTGRGTNAWPLRNDAAVIQRFGLETGKALLAEMKTLESEFYRSDANMVATSLPEMGAMASAQFRNRHPGVPEEIVTMLAWCYTFDHR